MYNLRDLIAFTPYSAKCGLSTKKISADIDPIRRAANPSGKRKKSLPSTCQGEIAEGAANF
jgi:hypothetical protein